MASKGTAKSTDGPLPVAIVIAFALATASCSSRNPAFGENHSPDPVVGVDAAMAVDADSRLDAVADSSLPADANVQVALDASSPLRDGPAADGLRVVLDGLNETNYHGSSTTYSPLTDSCPADQVLIGYVGSLNGTNNLVGSLQGTCGVLTIEKDGGGANQVVVRAGATLTVRGDASGTPWNAPCPQNQVVVGFTGRGGGSLDQVGFQCAPLLISLGGPTPTLSIGAVTNLPAHGGTGGTAFQEPCPTGQVARGYVTRIASHWVDTFSLVCGTPTLVP